MTPEEIEATEFFVGMRGYEKSEVRAFLQAVAADQRQLLARVAELESSGADRTVDPIDELGRQVAAVVRTAQEAGQALLAEAEQSAAAVRAAAEDEASRAMDEAGALSSAAKADRAEAERLLAEARASAVQIEEAATRRAREEADAILQAAEERRAAITEACDEMVNRLNDAVTGAQMSLLVLRPDGDRPGDEAEATSPADAC